MHPRLSDDKVYSVFKDRSGNVLSRHILMDWIILDEESGEFPYTLKVSLIIQIVSAIIGYGQYLKMLTEFCGLGPLEAD